MKSSVPEDDESEEEEDDVMMGEDEVAEIKAAKRKQKEMQAQREVQKIEKFEMIKASLDDASDGTVKKAAKKTVKKADKK